MPFPKILYPALVTFLVVLPVPGTMVLGTMIGLHNLHHLPNWMQKLIHWKED